MEGHRLDWEAGSQGKWINLKEVSGEWRKIDSEELHNLIFIKY
jgi:hypothetical protein